LPDLLVIRVRPEASRFIVKISARPLRLLEKTIFLPSGEYAGSPSDDVLLVRLIGSVPVGLAAKICTLAPLRRWKAISRPSGATDGCALAASGVRVRLVRSRLSPVPGIAKMSEPVWPVPSKRILLPSGDLEPNSSAPACVSLPNG
jgi:hypothetical protein